ncbi:MAG: CDP-diacylglycerol--serine O-phosphatidyltransferase [Acidobacteriota bacterium]
MTSISPNPPVRKGIRRGAYLLPSLFTMGNIILGFYAVVLGIDGQFERAGWMIFFAGILDGLDGRIARLTHTESEFGKEFDSLADVLTFGAAPAYLAFLWGLQDFGRIGWLLPVFFLLCTSVRLARFNVQAKTTDSRSFVGLPSPAAAAAIVALLWTLEPIARNTSERWPQIFMAVSLVVVGSLMISTFRYPSLKRINLRARLSYRAAMGIGVTLLVLTLRPQTFFELLAASFAVFGPLNWVWQRIWQRFRRRGDEEIGPRGGEAGGDGGEVAAAREPLA